MLTDCFLGTITLCKCLYTYCIYRFNCISNVDFVKRVCEIIANYNPYYVKLLQWGILEKYEEHDELVEYLRDFTNNVPYDIHEIDTDSLKEIVVHAKSTGDELVIEDVMKPLNSGTISIVFKGMLNGKPVIIKLKRPNIETIITRCISHMLIFIRLSNWINVNIYCKTSTKIDNIVLYNNEALLKQCDFMNEVSNIELFYQKYCKSKHIVIPEVYKRFTEHNADIIVMDYLDGRSVFDINQGEITEYSYLFNAFIFNTILSKKVIHMDLHIGNLLFMRDDDGKPKLGLIDFGMIHHLKKSDSNFLLKGTEYISKCDYINLLILFVHFTYDRNTIVENIEEKLQDIENQILTAHKNKEVMPDGFINEKDVMILLRLFKKHDIEINNDACNMILVFVCIMRLYSKFAEGKPIVEIYDQILIPQKIKIDTNENINKDFVFKKKNA